MCQVFADNLRRAETHHINRAVTDGFRRGMVHSKIKRRGAPLSILSPGEGWGESPARFCRRFPMPSADLVSAAFLPGKVPDKPPDIRIEPTDVVFD